MSTRDVVMEIYVAYHNFNIPEIWGLTILKDFSEERKQNH